MGRFHPTSSTVASKARIPLSHRIHVWCIPYHPWDWYIYLHEWFIFIVNVGKYTIPMDGMMYFYMHTFGVGFFDHTPQEVWLDVYRNNFQTKDSPKSEKINLDRFPWPNSPSKAGKLSRSGDLEERLQKSATVESQENKSIWQMVGAYPRHPNLNEQSQKNLVFLGYIGDYTRYTTYTQLCGDYFINHDIRIPIKRPGFIMESIRGAPVIPNLRSWQPGCLGV